MFSGIDLNNKFIGLNRWAIGSIKYSIDSVHVSYNRHASVSQCSVHTDTIKELTDICTTEFLIFGCQNVAQTNEQTKMRRYAPFGIW